MSGKDRRLLHPQERYEVEYLELVGDSTHPAADKARAVAKDVARHRWIMCGPERLSYVLAPELVEFHGERLAGKLRRVS